MRIGSHLSGIDLTAQHSLLRNLNQLSLSSVRLSTMQRINKGSDDPAGLIAVGTLQSELVAIQEAGNNASRAVGTIRVADAGMSQVTGLLNDIRGHIVAAAGGFLSDAELGAKQAEIDAALEAINRIGGVTSFGGRKLLDGQADVEFAAGFTGEADPITISGDALTFVFSPDVSQTSTLTLPNINTAALGGAAGRLADLAGGGNASLASGNFTEAIDILDAARDDVLQSRARAGAFEKYTVESSRSLLDEMEVAISTAVSAILDTDVATETSRLIQSQILVDSAVNSLKIAGRSRSLIGGLFDAI